MPTQVIAGPLADIFNPESWQNILGGVGDVVSEVATVWEQIERIQGSKPLTMPPSPPPTTPPYQSNLALGDFKFTPNVTLLFVGGVVLVVALILRR